MTKFFLLATFAFFITLVLVKETITTAQIYSNFATRLSVIANCRSTSGALSEWVVRGVTECARVCGQTGQCRSFFYNKLDGLCQLHDVVFEGYGPTLTYVFKTFHYKMNTVVSNFTCPSVPPGAAGYNIALLPDNTVFTYRIVWSLADKATAQTVCLADGAGLVQVLSLAKMQTLVNLFTTCPGYVYAGDYWIDVSNVNAGDFFDIQQWTTSGGEPLPTTTSNLLWAPGRPQNPDIYNCAALWAADDYQWNNIPCSYTNYYICEK